MLAENDSAQLNIYGYRLEHKTQHFILDFCVTVTGLTIAYQLIMITGISRS